MVNGFNFIRSARAGYISKVHRSISKRAGCSTSLRAGQPMQSKGLAYVNPTAELLGCAVGPDQVGDKLFWKTQHGQGHKLLLEVIFAAVLSRSTAMLRYPSADV